LIYLANLKSVTDGQVPCWQQPTNLFSISFQLFGMALQWKCTERTIVSANSLKPLHIIQRIVILTWLI